jgi:hypothetical protein
LKKSFSITKLMVVLHLLIIGFSHTGAHNASGGKRSSINQSIENNVE